MTHTPGPWLATHDSKTDPPGKIQWYIIAPESETMIADVNITERHLLHKPEDPEANSHMLAAAPDMLAALEGALYGFDELMRSYTYTHVVRQRPQHRRVSPDDMSAATEASDQYQAARRAVEDAIRKAKGLPNDVP